MKKGLLEDLPLLDSLSKATDDLIRPLRLAKWDYLEVWSHEHSEAFVMKAVSRKPKTDAFSGNGWLPEGAADVQVTETGVEVIEDHRQPSHAAATFFTRLPEREDLGARSWQRRGEWKVAFTDLNALVIHHIWPRDRIIFRGPTTRAKYDFLIRRFLIQSLRGNLQARFKLNGEVPEMPVDFKDSTELPLADYQKAALAFTVKQEGSALFMDTGTGKTAVSIQRICTEARMHRRGELGDKARMMRVLIVCPNQVRVNWREEFKHFSTVPGKVTIIKGGALKRLKLLTEAVKAEEEFGFTACIVGYDSVVAGSEGFEMIPWDLVILDESHKIKATNSKRAKVFLRDIRDGASRRMILTATPIANSIFNAYTQFEFLGQGLSGFSNFSAFKKFFGKWKNTGGPGGIQKLASYQNIPVFQERLVRMAFTVMASQVLDLPDKVNQIWEVEMTPKQTEFYTQVAEQLALEFSESKTMTTDHILTRLLRLAQITSGFVKWDAMPGIPGSVEAIPGGNPKLDALTEILTAEDHDPNMKTVIWACWKEDIRAIKAHLDSLGINCATHFGETKTADRDAAIHAFNNDPELKVLIGNPATMAEGLNLLGYDPKAENPIDTYAGREIFYSENWSMIERRQAEARCHRRGTRLPVTIIDLMVPDSVDEVIRHRVTAKIMSATQIQDVTDILREVLNINVPEGVTV
jgi:SNF2 family DNA or RNA helicase